MKKSQKYILWFSEVSKKDILLVGGKNASLGEMMAAFSNKGIRIPNGFALTSSAYWHFLKFNQIDKALKKIFRDFDPKNIKSLQATGAKARATILAGKFPKDLEEAIINAYKKLSQKYNEKNADVAVRSSGVCEDAPKDSFAGQFESFLNIEGEKELREALKKCFASAFNDRVIAYREEKKISHLKFALSVGVQKMIRSDLASSGIIFTLDTESGFKNVILINSIYGVGEMIVKGKITPDEFYVFKSTLRLAEFTPHRTCSGAGLAQGKLYKPIIVKNLGRKTKKFIYGKQGGLKEVPVVKNLQSKFSLKDKDILSLARWACTIEEHYGIAQDIEWAKDGKTGELFIVQSRPETVFAPKEAKFYPHTKIFGVGVYEEYRIKTKKEPVLQGIAIGSKIGWGKVRLIADVSKISQFKKEEVLVTKMTDPDWVSIFPMASAIVTDEGGSTCHAAIISRELGVPCIVGTRKATRILKTGQEITVDCTQGKEGRIFSGKIPFELKKYELKKIPKLKTKIMLNIGAPEIAFKSSFLPNDGVGLAREEFIIAEKIKVHPLALYHYARLRREIPNSKFQIPNKFKIPNSKFKTIFKKIEDLTVEHKDKREYFIKELAEGIGQIAAAFYPKEVIVRFSDFKTNEYRNLIGGELFEDEEANPMLGFRGASRYLDKKFQPAFWMECQAIKRVRDIFGLKNISLMIPFCRTPEEGRAVIKLMKKFGLPRRSLGEGGIEKERDGLKAYVMCELPSNVILVDEFLDIFDGMSIGSNDLTQLILGIDRDNAKIAYIGDERSEAVKEMIKKVISACRKKKKYCGICGEAPSTFTNFAEFLIEQKIPSISLSPDAVIKTILNLSKKSK